MGTAIDTQWKSVERWSSTLFLVGGALLMGHVAMLGVQAFSDLTTPPDVFGPTGHLVALVGLLGLYPVLADRTPMLARAGVAVAVVATVNWAVMTVTRLFAVIGIISTVSEVLPDVLFLLAFASTILTYVLFGAATLRVEDGSRVITLLLLAPSALILAALVGSTIAGVAAFAGVGIGGGLALSMLALGRSLRTWGRPVDSAKTAGTVTAG